MKTEVKFARLSYATPHNIEKFDNLVENHVILFILNVYGMNPDTTLIHSHSGVISLLSRIIAHVRWF